jgi:glycosyltransferase involved in cell wall biosynthesis
MSETPDVSVVMAVYNGAKNLSQTLDSVLDQKDCAVEFIVIDDGSTDGSGAILDQYAARDSRLRVIHQENAGLTRSLIRGCAVARGEFIARQDADDISMPGRFKEQSDFLRAHPDAVLVASGVRFVAPGGEWMFDVAAPAEVSIDLQQQRVELPPLVATCFRRDAYVSVGGFRLEFAVAQDSDLWLRLLHAGACLGLARVHYQATMTLGGISSQRRNEQLRLAALAVECARLRQSGQDDAPLLASYVPGPRRKTIAGPREHAAFHYFIGSCLRGHDPAAAKRYFALALRDNPLHFKALLRRILA